MKRKRAFPITAVNLTLIVCLLAIIAILTEAIIRDLTLKDIQNITRLTQNNIYSEIMIELTEPVNTSIIMAQNTFLQSFMDNETDETTNKISEYLTAIQMSSGYESVFFVPLSTLKYYHPGGSDAKVDLNSETSLWFRERMQSEELYAVEVNTEQLADYAMTIYVNASIFSPEDKFLGVTGVGKRIDYFQNILTRYKENQNVEAFVLDEDGVVKIHSNPDMINSNTYQEIVSNQFKSIDISESKEEIIENQLEGKFIIVQHISMLNWYLVVTKETSELATSLGKYIVKMYSLLVLGGGIMMVLTSFIIMRYKKRIIQLSNMDQLTQLPNRTIFENVFEESMRNVQKKSFCLALFDLDNLKVINDKYGHDQGDFALREISKLALDHIKSPNMVFRVGGDEFAIISFDSMEDTYVFLDNFRRSVLESEKLRIINVTISIGVTESNESEQKSNVYKRADKALYFSKTSGRNTIKII